MKKITVIAFLLVCITITNAQQEIHWMTIEEAVPLLHKEPRKMIVDVYTDWCGWCKVMDRTTYSDSIIIDYVNKNYYAVKLNAEQKEDIILGDKTYKFINNGGRGYNELAAFLLNGNLGYPSTVIIDETATVIDLKQGYIKPKQFDILIKFFGGDFHKKGTFEEFNTNYISPVSE